MTFKVCSGKKKFDLEMYWVNPII